MVPAVLPAGLPHGELGALTSSLGLDIYVIVQHLGLPFAQHNHVDVAGSGCLQVPPSGTLEMETA